MTSEIESDRMSSDLSTDSKVTALDQAATSYEGKDKEGSDELFIRSIVHASDEDSYVEEDNLADVDIGSDLSLSDAEVSDRDGKKKETDGDDSSLSTSVTANSSSLDVKRKGKKRKVDVEADEDEEDETSIEEEGSSTSNKKVKSRSMQAKEKCPIKNPKQQQKKKKHMGAAGRDVADEFHPDDIDHANEKAEEAWIRAYDKEKARTRLWSMTGKRKARDEFVKGEHCFKENYAKRCLEKMAM